MDWTNVWCLGGQSVLYYCETSFSHDLSPNSPKYLPHLYGHTYTCKQQQQIVDKKMNYLTTSHITKQATILHKVAQKEINGCNTEH